MTFFSDIPQNILLPSTLNPVKVILDTDRTGDCDDDGALAILCGAQLNGYAQLIAVLVGSKTLVGAQSAWQEMRYSLGPNTIPLAQYNGADGISSNASWYSTIANGTWGASPASSPASFPGHITTGRQALANVVASGSKCVYVSIGGFYIVRDLLASPADGISPLTGTQLFAAAVDRVVVMAGNDPFTSAAATEYNVALDVTSALAFQTYMAAMPARIEVVWVSFQLGNQVASAPAPDATNPYVTAFNGVVGTGNRPGWDIIAAYHAVMPERRVFLPIIKSGTNKFAADGKNTWTATLGHDTCLGLNPLMTASLASTTLQTAMDAGKPPALLPAVPVATVASTTSSAITVSVAIGTGGGLPATYALQRSTSPTFASGIVTAVAAQPYAGNPTSIVDTGLTSSTAYYYRASATNSAGTTAYSAIVSGTTAVSSGTLILDSLAAPAAIAYSTRKLRAAYAGSAIRVLRSSDSTQTDIGFVSGELDTAALLTFAGSGNATVVKWYDQAGATDSLVTGVGPTIVSAGTLQTLGTSGKAAPVWNSTETLSAAATIPSTTSMLISAAASNAVPGSQSSARVASFSNAATDWGAAGNFGLFVNNGSSFGLIRNNTQPLISGVGQGPLQLEAWSDGTNIGVSVNNGTAATAATSGSFNTSATFSVGTDAANERWKGAIGEVIFQTTYSAADRSAINASQKAYWATP